MGLGFRVWGTGHFEVCPDVILGWDPRITQGRLVSKP